MARPPKPKPTPAPPPLEHILAHTFRRPELLTLALTHRSSVYDSGPAQISAGASDPSHDNEQLEFLGDAVLGLLAAESLCHHFPALREGELTRLRASVVSRKHLGEVGTRLGLGALLKLGETTRSAGGRTNPALAANAVEAIIAALYVDGGLEPARRFVEDHVLGPALPEMERSLAEGEKVNDVVGDHKSALQEMLQSTGAPRPSYELIGESGPAHRKLFRIQVRLPDGEVLAEAERPSKKEAQQEAARLALGRLQARTAGDARA